MDASNAPSRDLVSGDMHILATTFYATIDEQARRRGKPEPSDDLTGLINPEVDVEHGVTFIPKPSFANQVAGSILDAGMMALRDRHKGRARFLTVSAPTGSGKSSYSWALVASILKAFPNVSIVYACETIQQCEATYWGLKEAMDLVRLTEQSVAPPPFLRNAGNNVGLRLAVFTGAHDINKTWEEINGPHHHPEVPPQ
jgi:hypothetical protein